jgi:hypothetical protein
VATYAGLVEVCSEVGCVEVAPSESVWVRALNARPELRRGAGTGGFKADGAVPEAPVNREVVPVPQPTQPTQPMQPMQPIQPIQPAPQTSPNYQGPNTTAPYRSP